MPSNGSLLIKLAILFNIIFNPSFSQIASKERKVKIINEGWELIGDLRLPNSDEIVPAVLMLNKANGTRDDYIELAESLAKQGIASLRLDLRGHGESINQGQFIPGEMERNPLIWDSESDVVAAYKFLKSNDGIDENRIGIIGASYSGEEMAEAGRMFEYASAYVALSPGSFSDESILGIDKSGVPWLFIVSNNERYLKEITEMVQTQSKTVELLIMPGTEHATRLLPAHPGLAERIAIWLEYHL